VAELVTRLEPLALQFIVLVAAGGFELVAAAALSAAGLPVAVVNPRQIRDFVEAIGQVDKTDAFDTQVLARFAAVVQSTPCPVPDADAQALTALLAPHQQAVRSRPAEGQRLGTARPPVFSACGPTSSGWST
jgi:transposase